MSLNISNCNFTVNTTEETKLKLQAISDIASAFEANAEGLKELVAVLSKVKSSEGPDAMIKVTQPPSTSCGEHCNCKKHKPGYYDIKA
jgi:hypothetical protein